VNTKAVVKKFSELRHKCSISKRFLAECSLLICSLLMWHCYLLFCQELQTFLFRQTHPPSAVWRTRLLNCYYFWCSFYCFYLIHFDRFICFYLPVSLLAIRLPRFNKLELSWVDICFTFSCHGPSSFRLGQIKNSWCDFVMFQLVNWRHTSVHTTSTPIGSAPAHMVVAVVWPLVCFSRNGFSQDPVKSRSTATHELCILSTTRWR